MSQRANAFAGFSVASPETAMEGLARLLCPLLAAFVVAVSAACNQDSNVASPHSPQPDGVAAAEFALPPDPPKPRRAFPDTSATIAILADQLPGGLTAAQQRVVADRFVGTQKLTLELSHPLRALKPGFLVLHYHLAIWQSAPGVSFIVNGRTWGNDYPEVDKHEAWFWHNANGQRVASRIDKKLLMNVGDAGFTKYWADSIVEQVRSGDYDGVFADSASPALLPWEANTPPEPRLAGSGARHNRFAELGGRTFVEAWQSFIISLDAALAAHGVPLIPNTGAFVTTWDPTRYDLTAGVFVEGFADPGFTEPDWKASTNRLLSLADKSKIIILQNYLRSTQDLERRRYYLANYLLVKADRTYLDYFANSPLEWYPEWSLDLGRALSTAKTVADLAFGGIYRRDFVRGAAIVNPSGAPVTVMLATPMKRVEPVGGGAIDANGALLGAVHSVIVGSIVVPAHGAEVLLK
jgi:hypothetical protein